MRSKAQRRGGCCQLVVGAAQAQTKDDRKIRPLQTTRGNTNTSRCNRGGMAFTNGISICSAFADYIKVKLAGMFTMAGNYTVHPQGLLPG